MSVEVTTIPQEFDRYGINKEAELAELAADRPLPGYPEMKDRWHIPVDKWDEMATTGVIAVPDGPWNITNHPERTKARAAGFLVDDEGVVDPWQAAIWREQELFVTDRGLPVHPLGRLGVTAALEDGTPIGGMATGIGRHWHYGPLTIGNFALSRNNQGADEYAVVATRRGAKERFSFPGGYGDVGETPVAACVREGKEEAGLDAIEQITGNSLGSLVHKLVRISPSLGGPNTLNAWLDEHFAFAQVSDLPAVRGLELRTNDPQEVRSVVWMPEGELTNNPNFMGAHRRALRAHVASHKRKDS